MFTNLLLAICLASLLLFAGMIWITRAGPKRATAALAGCISATVFSLGWDALAKSQGWWTYTYGADLLVTLTLSISIAFLFGGVAGLAGWRMIRAMGWTGAVAFFVAFAGIGLLRDHSLDINTSLFDFGKGPMPQVMSALGYLTMAIAVQVTMFVMVGPPTRDELRGLDADAN